MVTRSVLALLFLPILISLCLAEEFTTELPENGTVVEFDTLISPVVGLAAEEFTPAEKEALAKFRPLAAPLLTKQRSDQFLMTWLRAQNLNIKAAGKMLADAQKWRADFKLDGITKETIYDFRPKPYDATAYTRDGLPFVILAPSHIDIRSIIQKGEREKLFRYLIQIVEFAMVNREIASKRLGKEVVQVGIAIDFDGFSLKQHTCLKCVGIFKDTFLSFENYYPGILKHLVLINVPKIAIPLIDVLKVIISKENRKGLKIIGPDKKEWTSYLSNIIELDQLPTRYGGTRVDTQILSVSLPDSSMVETTEEIPYTTEDPDHEK